MNKNLPDFFFFYLAQILLTASARIILHNPQEIVISSLKFGKKLHQNSGFLCVKFNFIIKLQSYNLFSGEIRYISTFQHLNAKKNLCFTPKSQKSPQRWRGIGHPTPPQGLVSNTLLNSIKTASPTSSTAIIIHFQLELMLILTL